jgi:fused signal recognition particle receptor
MKFLWGRKKAETNGIPGTPEIPVPEPEPSPPPPPETPPEPGEPETPPPLPEPFEPTEPPVEIPESPPEMRAGFFSRLAAGLKRSSSQLADSVASVFSKRKLDAAALGELEEALIAADLGPGPAARVVARLKAEKFDKQATDAEIRAALASVVAETLKPHEKDFDLSGPSPQVVMFVGVNGSGKTTTLGKIAAMIVRQGKRPVLAAGDTFRAAAIEQVQVWGERAGAPVVARAIGADAAGLVFDAYAEAKAKNADVLLVDTAGRLQNKAGLMQELAKIVRVLKKQDETAPHHVLLVLDATVGQNALSQAQAFREIAGVTGIVMTKLDGTAKGGVLVALADKHPGLPIYFTGVGEGIDDLKPFSAEDFAKALAGA